MKRGYAFRNHRRLGALVLVFLLVACGTPPAAEEPTAPVVAEATAVATSPPTTAPPPTEALPTEEMPTENVATLAPPTEAPPAEAVPPTEAPTPEGPTYLGLPQGVNAAGAPTLGFADAPIVLTDYSDFL